MSLWDKMTGQIWVKVYDILVEECGAHESERDSFIINQLEKDHPREWRFCGSLGFGGKFWRNSGRLYVNCYNEDATPKRLAMIEKANARLEKLGG
jgi:hypothetical protein